MSEYYVGNEGEAEQVLSIITHFLETDDPTPLPVVMNIVVPTQRFKGILNQMIVQTIREKNPDIQHEFPFTVNIYAKEDLHGNDATA